MVALHVADAQACYCEPLRVQAPKATPHTLPGAWQSRRAWSVASNGHALRHRVLTVRRIFEPAIAALAARVASDEALRGIGEAYAGMESAKSPGELLEPDLAFGPPGHQNRRHRWLRRPRHPGSSTVGPPRSGL